MTCRSKQGDGARSGHARMHIAHTLRVHEGGVSPTYCLGHQRASVPNLPPCLPSPRPCPFPVSEQPY